MRNRDYLQQLLLALQPTSVCALDPAAAQLARALLPTIPVHTHGTADLPPCTLALGIDALNDLDAQQSGQLIHRVRLYSAPHILLVAQAQCALDEAAFRALGFALSMVDPTDQSRIYDYDLANYKTVPDWLNARYWAHPERWES
jgi:hypothetical protein